ncbi:T9SS type A sorting domain-containing protein [Dyadobacter luticola]|uniref:T9SS type A sorting domain-containing protein n=1 Tax=Dyadobacter luticola TaxID=1979387 RepID=A0A5R9KY80_9BACT|nr:T9SS type A sorting domain-containing protein [Dyadobacter luticola]TLV01121.1 T9SS type A sorting domain-containing protein [Dyadobacter luticola]
MKQTLRVRWTCLGVWFVCFFCLNVSDLRAQQRYFAVSMVNENDDPELDVIQGSKDVGANAVALTIQWGSIEGKISRILKQEHGENYNVWKQYDDQIALATSLGMKIAINVAVSTGDDATNSLSDRYGIDTGDGWAKEDRVVVINYSGEGAVFQKQGGPIRPGLNLQFVMTSLVAQSTRDRITSFAKKVMQRYKYLLDSDDLLYINVIFSRAGEGEFDMGSSKYHYDQMLDMSAALSDYSTPMVNGYRNWLQGKYGNIMYLNSQWGSNYPSFGSVFPKLPSGSTYTGADGNDWFLYRTAVLKETNNIFRNAVREVDSRVTVITHHGSVFDKLSSERGTLAFKEIGADLDGIKINDDIHYDHRFALDLLRSNLPDRFYINEAAYYSGTQFAEELTEESYKHGANMVTIFHMDDALASPSARDAMKALTDKWVKNKNVTKLNPSNNDTFALSNMLNADGCETNRDSYSGDCDAYRNWRNAYNNAGSKPVNIFMVDDVTTPGCFYKDLRAANNNDNVSAIIPDNQYYHLTGNDCRLVGTVKGNNLTNGNTPFNAKVTIDGEVKSYKSQPYVQRHFAFKPGGTNPSQARLTIYVSQDEFTAFNQLSTVRLPTNSGDINGKTKLRIWQWHGDNALTGNPDEVIDPADEDIQWDGVLNMWRIAFNVNGFSSFFVTADKAGPLPVTLARFEGEKVEHSASLTWQTSEETSSDHFEIQHSMDGKQWSEIGNVNSAGESVGLKSYSFVHPHPLAGDNFYRLKMVDLDGTFAYSKMVLVGFEKGAATVVFPNPVNSGIISLQYSGAVPAVTLTDVMGKEIVSDIQKNGPNNLLVKPQGKLAPGLYILTADYGTMQTRHKVAVVN